MALPEAFYQRHGEAPQQFSVHHDLRLNDLARRDAPLPVTVYRLVAAPKKRSALADADISPGGGKCTKAGFTRQPVVARGFVIQPADILMDEKNRGRQRSTPTAQHMGQFTPEIVSTIVALRLPRNRVLRDRRAQEHSWEALLPAAPRNRAPRQGAGIAHGRLAATGLSALERDLVWLLNFDAGDVMLTQGDGAIPVTVRMGEGAVTGARSTLEPIVEKGRERASARRFGSGSGLWPRASARHLDLPAKLGRAAEPIRFRRRLSADRRQCAARC